MNDRPQRLYICRLCVQDGTEFKVPAGDHIGVELMRYHILEMHPLETRSVKTVNLPEPKDSS